MLDFLMQGGIISFVLLFLFIYVLASFFFQILTFKRQYSPMVQAISEQLNSSTVDKTLIEQLELLNDPEMFESLNSFNKQLYWLRFIMNISPLLGLLGTVLGIMKATHGMLTQNSFVLFKGIGESLITTAMGLCVSIPAMFVFFLGTKKMNHLLMTVKKKCIEK